MKNDCNIILIKGALAKMENLFLLFILLILLDIKTFIKDIKKEIKNNDYI